MEEYLKHLKDNGEYLEFDRKIIRENVPIKSGIYYIYSKELELLYIGKAVNLRGRLFNHLNDKESGWSEVKDGFEYVRYSILDGEEERVKYEKFYINLLKPKLNRKDVVTYETEYYNSKYNNGKLTKLLEKQKEKMWKEIEKDLENFIL